MFEFNNNLYKKLTTQFQEMYGIDAPNLEFYQINGLDIPFSSFWKRIAINLSGGADSACLTFLICKIIQDNNL